MLAEIFRFQQKDREAAAHYEQALMAKPRDLDAHVRLMNAYALTGEKEKASDVLRRAIVLQPDAPSLHHLLCMMLDEMGRTEEAKRSFRAFMFTLAQELKKTPDDALVHKHFADIVRLADGLREWKTVMETSGPFANDKSTNLLHRLIYMRKATSARKHDVDLRNFFLQTLNVARDVRNKEYQSLPAGLYWHLVGLAGPLRAFDALADFCAGIAEPTVYRVYALHAAWRSRDQALIQRQTQAWENVVRLVASVSSWDRELSVLQELQTAIDRFPKEMVRDPRLRGSFQDFRRLVRQAAAAQPSPQAAK